MKSKSIFSILTLLVIQSCQAQDFNAGSKSGLEKVDFKQFDTSPRTKLNFTELCEFDGYRCENHTVTTADGYILSVFRLPRSENCLEGEGRSPIVFLHGSYLTGDDCIVAGPGTAHCYIYNDACYDVWVPNTRGNRYSKRHVSLNPEEDSDFWDFSVDEIAAYDLTSVIDYVLDHTQKKKIIYVGHSQGVPALLLLCAKQPEYNDKVEIGFGLSTVAWLDHARFLLVKLAAAAEPFLTPKINAGFNAEVLPHGGFLDRLGTLMCSQTTLSYPLCSALLFIGLGYNRFQITKDVLPVVVSHVPGGTSLKNFNRWGQIINNGFTEYDYGTIENNIKYGQPSPPEYDLSEVSMRWVFISSVNDYVGDPRDIEKLVSKLPNATQCILEDKTFGHLDFLYGKDIPNYITPKILSTIATGELKC